MNTPIRPIWISQDAGGKHDVHHIDYSQQLILVAPWCQIMEADGTMTGMRTAHVYRSKKLAPLVSDDGNPFQATRLNFDRAAVDQNRALFWEHEEGRWRSKKRSGKGLLDPIPMPTVSKL